MITGLVDRKIDTAGHNSAPLNRGGVYRCLHVSAPDDAYNLFDNEQAAESHQRDKQHPSPISAPENKHLENGSECSDRDTTEDDESQKMREC